MSDSFLSLTPRRRQPNQMESAIKTMAISFETFALDVNQKCKKREKSCGRYFSNPLSCHSGHLAIVMEMRARLVIILERKNRPPLFWSDVSTQKVQIYFRFVISDPLS